MKTPLPRTILPILLTLTALPALLLGGAPEAGPAEEKLAWWKEARFGMFIHWGVYAVPAGEYRGQDVPGASEWIMSHARIPVAEYRELARSFDPIGYRPDDWASLAKEAGMRYIVITAKHHDGFALFGSRASSWNVVDATPYHRDLLLPLADACRKQGLRLGFYYSQAQDWVNGGSTAEKKWDAAQERPMEDYFGKVALPQVHELLTRYGKGTPAVLWWDTPIGMTPELAGRMREEVARDAPDLITNNRLGGGVPGDFETPEGFIPGMAAGLGNWETCMTTNRSWGFKKSDTMWKTSGELIRMLCEANAKGGNFLLNVGPKSDGTLPEPVVAALRGVGAWMETHHEAIYGTEAGPFPYRMPWGFASRKGNDLYLFLFDRPPGGRLEVPLRNRRASASLLGDGRAVNVAPASDGLVVQLPPLPGDAEVPVVKLSCSEAPVLGPLPPPPLPPLIPQTADGTFALKATDAQLVGAHIGGGANIGFWSATDSYPAWRIDVRQDGAYKVDLVYAVNPAYAGSGGAIVANGRRYPFTVAPTASWGDYQSHIEGPITLAKGVTTLSIRMETLPKGAAMNLKAVVVRPSPQGP